MTGVAVIVDRDDLNKLERKTKTVARPPLERVVERAAPFVQREARSHAPWATGALVRSIGADVRGLDARVTSNLPYAMAVEFGRGAGAKMPPASAFKGGFVAARAVAKRGIKGRFFVRRALQLLRNHEMPRLLSRAAREIETAWGGR